MTETTEQHGRSRFASTKRIPRVLVLTLGLFASLLTFPARHGGNDSRLVRCVYSDRRSQQPGSMAVSGVVLILTPQTYVSVPLKGTYEAAYRSLPRRWRAVLEA